MTEVTGSRLLTHIQQQIYESNTPKKICVFMFSAPRNLPSEGSIPIHIESILSATTVVLSTCFISSLSSCLLALSPLAFSPSLLGPGEPQSRVDFIKTRKWFTWGEQTDKTPIVRLVGQAMEVVGGFVNQKELFLLTVVYMINRTEGRKKTKAGSSKLKLANICKGRNGADTPKRQ